MADQATCDICCATISIFNAGRSASRAGGLELGWESCLSTAFVISGLSAVIRSTHEIWDDFSRNRPQSHGQTLPWSDSNRGGFQFRGMLGRHSRYFDDRFSANMYHFHMGKYLTGIGRMILEFGYLWDHLYWSQICTWKLFDKEIFIIHLKFLT